MTVGGVVGNVRHHEVTAGPGLDPYMPYRQTIVSGVSFVVRTRSDPRGVAPALSSLVWGIDPNQSLFDVRPMQDRVATIFWHQHAAGWLFAAFAALALVLAASGLYAVLSYAVSQQRRELGVRIALGAVAPQRRRPRTGADDDARRRWTRRGPRGAVAIARAIGGLLFGIGATDLRTFIAVPLLLACVAPGCLSASAPRDARRSADRSQV
jgi:putative ABC transport system permease protein